jgi:hypothetical protein
MAALTRAHSAATTTDANGNANATGKPPSSRPDESLARPIPIPASPGFGSPAAQADAEAASPSGRPVYSSYTHSLARSLVEAVLFQGQSVQTQNSLPPASVASTYAARNLAGDASKPAFAASVASVPTFASPSALSQHAVAASGPAPPSALALHRAASTSDKAHIPAAPRSTRATAPKQDSKPAPTPRSPPPAASPPARVPSSLASSFMGSPTRFSHSPAASTRGLTGFSRLDDDDEAMASFTRSLQGTLTSELDESLLQADDEDAA